MEQTQQQERVANELIAEFMGYKTNKHNQCYRENLGDIGWEYIQFNTSWDWLMPVVEKIESLGYGVKIHGKSTLIMDFDGISIINPPFGYGEECSKIEHTYNAVVEFIKWYNKNEE